MCTIIQTYYATPRITGNSVQHGPTKRFPSSQCASATKCLEILDALRLKVLLNGAPPGIDCDEVIHSILDLMHANAPYTVIQRPMHIHPTASELIPTMLGELKPLG